MIKKEVLNSRYLMYALKSDETNFMHGLTLVDELIDQAQNLERMNYDIYLRAELNDESQLELSIGRMVGGRQVKGFDQIFMYDEGSGEVFETTHQLKSDDPAKFVESVKEILSKNQLKKINIRVPLGNFKEITLISREMSSLN